MDLTRLKALIDLVGSAALSDLDLTEGGVRVRIKSARSAAKLPTTGVDGRRHGLPELGTAEVVEAGFIVRSPLSGTFFPAPSPSSPPFHQIGDKVGKNSTICIVEAMKTMTHVVAGSDGTLKAVLVENGAMVEFGQPLFELV